MEEILQDFESRYSYLYQGTVYENGGGNFSPVHESVKHWLRTTLHHQLQKARADWLRSEIEKLEGMQIDETSNPPIAQFQPLTMSGINPALTTIITRYKAELLELDR